MATLTRLRKQGGAVVLTIPSDIAQSLGWRPGTEIELNKQGECLNIISAKRQRRGRKTLSQLLTEINPQEIKVLNQSVAFWNETPAVGKEYNDD
ncbi:AbrB/MazE/SpoVT family DNA-binding domain-containing protein [Photorhabdus sp. P32]|uniref:AbrB/MazE/SpoVT family DNA-binding domain-containing protein n=1 Tax=Photorhabdus sp. P32 TaxID=3117549 RepID=UPI00311AE74B